MMKYLEQEKIEKLPTKRILALYKKVRPKILAYIDSHYCECCGMPTCDFTKGLSESEKKIIKEKWQKEIDDANNYLTMIKSILDTREHVKR